jgi:hypothetical protein|tara:strand:- start:700 stop:1524 length:825 start_codon:yes stop_codon:yes gene_type:complete
LKLTKKSLIKIIEEELESLFFTEEDKPEKKDDKESEGPKSASTDIMDNPFDEKEKKEKKEKEKYEESKMNYKDLMKEMYGVSTTPSKKPKVKKPIKKYTLTENIKDSSFYDNLTPMDKYNINRYIKKDVKLYEGVIGFSKSDSIANGVEVPQKYIQTLTEAKKHGFDLTDFKPKGFQKVLKDLKIRPKAQLDRNESGWEWKGNGITIVTGNNPLTGEYASAVSGKSPIKRKLEKNYASYIGVEGKPELVQQAVESIRRNASYIKNESPNRRDYI